MERRDVGALKRALAPGFLHRTPGKKTRDADTFLRGILEASLCMGDVVVVRG
jgi:hypothetical protein